LIASGDLIKLNPESLPIADAALAALGSVSDLMDEQWVELASQPDRFSLPHGNLGPEGEATWQIFQSKIPTGLLEAFESQERLRRHLVLRGNEMQSWTLSYAAGSAAALNVHLAAAEGFGLAPVTDSELHHHLLMLKLARTSAARQTRAGPLSADVVEQLAHKVSVALLEQVLPRSSLESISIDDILGLTPFDGEFG
jgi:hypothetical protein